jgi:hypothetical protein
MQIRREMFSATKKAPTTGIIPATVNHRIDKKEARLADLTSNEKMLCALRKALTKMSDAHPDGCRYFIANNKVQLLSPPSATAGKAGEARTYSARGRCKLGVCHPGGHSSSMMIEFSLSFRDVIDDRGLADVDFIDPTVIDELPRGTPVDASLLA